MALSASYKSVIKHYHRCPATISAYFNNFRKLVEEFQYEGAVACVFRAKLATDSDGNFPLIPIQTFQSFRCKLATDSELNLPA